MKRYRAKQDDLHGTDSNNPGFWTNGHVLYPDSAFIPNKKPDRVREKQGIMDPLVSMRGKYPLTIEDGSWSNGGTSSYHSTRFSFAHRPLGNTLCDDKCKQHTFAQTRYLVPITSDKKHNYTFWADNANSAITVLCDGKFWGLVMPMRADGFEKIA